MATRPRSVPIAAGGDHLPSASLRRVGADKQTDRPGSVEPMSSLGAGRSASLRSAWPSLALTEQGDGDRRKNELVTGTTCRALPKAGATAQCGPLESSRLHKGLDLMATVIWKQDAGACVSSVADLDDLLDELSRQAQQDKPLIVEVVAPNGAILSIGLGRPLSVVAFVPSSLDPPYLHSVGGDSSADELAFYFQGAYSELPPESGIPISQARECVRLFFQTGELPQNIAWQET